MSDPATNESLRTGTQPSGKAETVEEAREQIEQTREGLGETVQALADKADVKAKARRKLDEAKHRMDEKTSSLQESFRGTSSEGMTERLSQAFRRVAEEVRARPVAAAAAAAAIAGMMIGRRTKRR